MEADFAEAASRKVKVYWGSDGLRCEPEEVRMDSRRGDRVEWQLESDRPGARIVAIEFADRTLPKGPFLELAADRNPKTWTGQRSNGAAYGRYKYSITVSDERGEPIELDPYILDTDRP